MNATESLPQAVSITNNDKALAQQLRQQMAAVRIGTGKFGVRRKLSNDQTEAAAEQFQADRAYVSASKKIINTGNAKYRAVTGIISEAKSYWRDVTIPYPEPGIRLIRRDKVENFVAKMLGLKVQLDQATAALEAEYVGLIEQAKTSLGELYNPSDYPPSIAGEFRIDYDFPSVDPPAYLRQISPELYEAEQARIQARFEAAIQLTEDALIGEFHKLVEHLAERLQFGPDGKPKMFCASSVDGLKEFFGRFSELNIRNNDALAGLVAKAQGLVGSVEPKTLRNDVLVRKEIQGAMSELANTLDGLMVNRPKRAMALDNDDA